MIILCVWVYVENSYGQFNKKWFVRLCVHVYMLGKCTESLCP